MLPTFTYPHSVSGRPPGISAPSFAMQGSKLFVVFLVATRCLTEAAVDPEGLLAVSELAAHNEEQAMGAHFRKLGMRRVRPSNVQVEDPDPDDQVQATVRSDPVLGTLPLNRASFYSTVFEANNVTDLASGVDAEVVEEWVVEFCVHWWTPCTQFEPLFDEAGGALEAELNDERIVTKKVRFARVNCATDKVLCNEQWVEEYPTVNHYKGRQLVEQWTSRSEKSDTVRLQKWLHKSLVPALTEGEAEEVDVKSEAEDADWGQDLACSAGVGLVGLWAFWRVANLEESKAVPEEDLKGVLAAAETPAPAAEGPASAWRPRADTPLLPQAWAQERSCIEL